MPVQYARPTSDISTGGWTPTPLYAQLDETVATTTETIKSLAGAATDTAEVALSLTTDPNLATGHVIRVMHRKDAPGGTSQINMTYILRQGPSVEIQRWEFTNISYDWTVETLTLGVTETDAISAYGSLRLRWIKTQA